jgi:Na+-transporting methylmalonyl-CoA/oxaloacetate decarboxylase gamma subunit
VSVWSIALMGVVVVFAVLWALTAILTAVGRFAARSETNGAEGSVLRDDAAVIAAVMRHRGVVGSLRIRRIN